MEDSYNTNFISESIDVSNALNKTTSATSVDFAKAFDIVA